MVRLASRWFGLALTALLAVGGHGRAQEAVQPVAATLPLWPALDAPRAEPVSADLPKFDLRISPNTQTPSIEQPQIGPANIAMMQLAIESTEYMDERYLKNSMHPDDMGLWEHFRTGTGDQIHRLLADYKNFYLSENILGVGVAVAIVAPIANTHADQGFRDWYQRGAGQSSGANNTAKVFKSFGEWQYAVPIYFAFSLSEHIFPDSPTFQTIGLFGNRSLRALAVGAPAVGILQPGLGSGRPYTGDSHWSPLDYNNGVSGHAFVGAVPFLTAASMTDNYALKALLIAGSFGPAWSRIQSDDHYLSQVLLGWAIAYLAVDAVNLTECQSRCLRVVPVNLPQGVGLGVRVEY